MKHRISESEIMAQLPRIRVEADADARAITGTTWVDGDIRTTWDERRTALSREEDVARAIEAERISTAAELAAPAGWDAIGRDESGRYAEVVEDRA